jgi:hypothetical protein
MLLSLPVPPSTRQAAGPLIENLPIVLTGDRRTVDLSQPTPSSQGIQWRLFSRLSAQAVGAGFTVADQAVDGATEDKKRTIC